MWEINLNNQIYTVLFSFILGFCLCVFYDVIRALRKAGHNSDLVVFIGDVFFFFTASVIVFLFFIARTNGEIRGYVLFCAFIGFLLFRLTVSKLIFSVLVFAFSKIRIIYTAVYRLIYNVFYRIWSFFEKNLKKIGKNLKKLLKSVYVLLYTKSNK